MRILLIDDEVTVTENLTLYLEGQYHAVESLQPIMIREGLITALDEFQPEGIILDFEMAPVEGDKVYRWIKEWNDTVPVVFYTKYANSVPQRGKMLTAGASEDQIVAKQEVGDDYDILVRVLRNLRPR